MLKHEKKRFVLEILFNFAFCLCKKVGLDRIIFHVFKNLANYFYYSKSLLCKNEAYTILDKNLDKNNIGRII